MTSSLLGIEGVPVYAANGNVTPRTKLVGVLRQAFLKNLTRVFWNAVTSLFLAGYLFLTPPRPTLFSTTTPQRGWQGVVEGYQSSLVYSLPASPSKKQIGA